MEDDPDDLAAAFFAAQAAKEQQKAKLPTEDWIAAITSLWERKKLARDRNSTNASVADEDDSNSSRHVVSTSHEAGYEATVSSWLVTTIPDHPMQKQDKYDFIEIELNGNECDSVNLLQRECVELHQSCSPSVSLSAEDAEISERRERIKQSLVQKLLHECDSD